MSPLRSRRSPRVLRPRPNRATASTQISGRLGQRYVSIRGEGIFMKRLAFVVVGLAVLATFTGTAQTSTLAQTSAPTFAKDVAPIMFNKCANCHRPGEVAPMSLLSY